MAGVMINYKSLASFLADFYAMTDIRITFWSIEGKKCAVGAPDEDSAFCSCLQSAPNMKEACQFSDRQAIELAKQTKDLCLWTCHAGMKEYVYPVFHDDVLLGFFMIGQVRMDDRLPLNLNRKLIENLGLDWETMHDLYNKLPLVTPEKMVAATNMLDAFASFLYYKGLVKRRELPLIDHVEEFVRSNITDQITINDICRELSVSRSKLCHTMREEKDMSVVQVINQIRISVVKKMLDEGHTVKEAAFAAGFTSAAYCSRVFKQYINKTPEQYLKSQ